MPRGAHGKINTKQIAPKVWEADARYRNGRGDLDRMRRRGTSKTGAENNLKEALLEVANKIKAGKIDGATRVRRVADLWKVDLRKHAEDGILSWSTVDGYIYDLDLRIVPHVGSLQICELDAGECDELFKKLREITTLSMTRAVRVTLGQLCKFAIRGGGLTSNPVDHAEDIRTGKDTKPQKPRGLTPEQRKDLMAKLRDFVAAKQFDKRGRPRGANGRVWTLMPDILDAQVATGARIGEVICLTGNDVDPTERKITLAAHWVYEPEIGPVAQPGRKGNLPPITVKVPEKSLPMWRRLKLASGGGLLFTGRGGSLLDEKQFLRLLKEAFVACGYPWLTSHQMRKTTSKAMKARGMSDEDVARQLGNTKSIAKKHYIEEDHANPAAAAALEVLFE
jgi:integrase